MSNANSIRYGLTEDCTPLNQQNWNLPDYNSTQPPGSLTESVANHPEQNSPEPKRIQEDEMTIEDLSYNFMQFKLSPILDKNKDEDKDKNIFALAEAMSFSEDDITFLRNCYAGGGDPAGDFLTTMVTELPDMPVSELRVCLQDNDLPPKALQTISSYKDDNVLDDISPLHMDNLALKLTSHGKTKYDWKYVAEQFGFKDRIPLFKAAIKRNNIMSPTKALIDLIKTKKPRTKMIDFIKYLERIGNTEAAQEVRMQVDDQCKK